MQETPITRLLTRLRDMDASNAVLPAIPVGLQLPAVGATVRFWTCHRLDPSRTLVRQALTGIFRDGVFWVESDHWSVGEVTHWTDR